MNKYNFFNIISYFVPIITQISINFVVDLIITTAIIINGYIKIYFFCKGLKKSLIESNFVLINAL